MSLSATLNILFNCINTKALDLNTARDILALTGGVTFTDGTGANQADTLFHDTRTLADGANETLDLYASGTLTDAFGDALTIETLKALYIKNNSTDANLLIGAAAVNAIGLFSDSSDILKLPPGGELVFIAPDATGVDITTNKNLKIAHDGTGSSDLTYDIIVIGVD